MKALKRLYFILRTTKVLRFFWWFLLVLLSVGLILRFIEPQIETIGDGFWFLYAAAATIGFGESLLQGQVAATPVNTVVGPVKGNNAVVVFTVTGEEQKGRQYTFEEYANQFNGNLNLGNVRFLSNSTNMVNLLRVDNKIENNSLNFVAAFGE